jgi:diguanylate cyclase (GGDEF)-like protein/PAS domain S-box-containing protein
MSNTIFDTSNYDLSYYSLPVAVVGAMSLGLGLATIIRERGSPVSVAFLLMQTTVAAWLVSFAFVYSTNNEETARTWLRIMSLGLVCIPVAVLAFAGQVADRWGAVRKFVGVSAAISAAFAVLGNVRVEWFTGNVVDHYWGYYPAAGPMVGAYAAYQTSCLLGASALLWSAQRQTRSQTQRRRLRVIFFALSLSYLSGFDFLPASGIEIYPLGFVFVAAFVLLGTRAIWKYRLVDLTPELAATQIINTISEALIVVDPDGIVRVANASAAELLGTAEDSLAGRRLEDVIAEPPAGWQEVVGGSLSKAEIDFRREESTVTVVVSASPLENHGGEEIGTILLVHDITERKQAEEALARKEALYRALVETSPDAVFVTDRVGVIVMANKRAEELLQIAPDAELVGESALKFVIPEDEQLLRETLSKVSETTVVHGQEYTLLTATRERVPAEVSISRIRDSAGEVDGYMTVARDVTERKQAEDAIRHFAYHDALTGLANRSLMMQELSDAMAAADEGPGKVAVLYMDLDGMKAINDNYGHAIGDDLLKRVADRLRSAIREEDSLARVGGDEFVFVMADVQRAEQVSAVAERILAALKSPFALAGEERSVSISIGIAVYPDDAAGISGLLREADEAMYRAKALGGNQYEFAVTGGDLARAI